MLETVLKLQVFMNICQRQRVHLLERPAKFLCQPPAELFIYKMPFQMGQIDALAQFFTSFSSGWRALSVIAWKRALKS
jgi:hypothetical protein